MSLLYDLSLQELLDATHHILGELEKEHKAHKAPQGLDALKPDADADELREKFRIVRVSPASRFIYTDGIARHCCRGRSCVKHACPVLVTEAQREPRDYDWDLCS